MTVTYDAVVDLAPKRILVRVRRGDDVSVGPFYIETVDADTGAVTPVDITGDTILAQIRRQGEQTTADASWTVTITDGPAGEFILTAAAAVTQNLTGWYQSDIEWTPAGGTKLTVASIDLESVADVTR